MEIQIDKKQVARLMKRCPHAVPFLVGISVGGLLVGSTVVFAFAGLVAIFWAFVSRMTDDDEEVTK